ncbi:hypothetical protein QC9_2444 [Clostridioides difficile CD39]|nr:hypothetical protein [Clostridioides difficile]EQE47839.1 hypothetical protein QC9_2444 [Clostridioides difficile CD39]
MTKCPKCGKEVSSRPGSICPRCGFKVADESLKIRCPEPSCRAWYLGNWIIVLNVDANLEDIIFLNLLTW